MILPTVGRLVRNKEEGFLSWNAPKGFPFATNRNFKNGFLYPQKLSYDKLHYATYHVHCMVVAGKMTKSQAELFLAYYCINKKAATHIVHHAQNMRALDALGSTDNTSDEYLAMLERKKNYPLEFEEWKYPTFWMRAMRLDSQIDVPMHLVFLGAVQGVIGFIHSWLRKHNK